MHFLWGAASLLVVAGLVCEVVLDSGYRETELMKRFQLDQEGTVPVWFSSAIMLLCTSQLVLISRIRANAPQRRQWLAMAVLFAGMSMDETASFHEWTNNKVELLVPASTILGWGWVALGLCVAGACLIYFWPLLWQLPTETFRRFVAGGFVYCLGALGMETLGGRHFNAAGKDLTYRFLFTAEEALEMAGLILMLHALVCHLERSKAHSAADAEVLVGAGH